MISVGAGDATTNKEGEYLEGIGYTLKRKCAELANLGEEPRRIYDNVFYPAHKGMSYNTFKRKMRDWRKKKWADDVTLEAANLDWSYTPYAATVQVNAAGSVTQAWVKQTANGKGFEELIAEIRKNTPHIVIKKQADAKSCHMLEIPLFDLHLGIANLEWYKPTVQETLSYIYIRRWKKILVVIGQDMFHNDDFRGRTSSGRSIEKVDMVQAWKDAKAIYYSILDAAFLQADEVEIIYIRGNHDESMSWAFVQMLAERYGAEHTDDSLAYKKVRTFGKCFIGFTHGDGKKSTARDLRGQFTVKFPIEFANADIREIHAGHIHHEKDSGDDYGIMCRRLCSGNEQDDWSDSEGFEGAIKRFVLFDWSDTKLSGTYYV